MVDPVVAGEVLPKTWEFRWNNQVWCVFRKLQIDIGVGTSILWLSVETKYCTSTYINHPQNTNNKPEIWIALSCRVIRHNTNWLLWLFQTGMTTLAIASQMGNVAVVEILLE